MPTSATQKSIDAHMKRKVKMIEIGNKRHTCGPVLKHIKEEYKKKIKEGKCGKKCIEEIKGNIKNFKDNCGDKAVKKFEKEIGIKLEDNIVLKF